MPTQLKGSLLYVTYDNRRTVAIFWSILIGLLILSLLLTVLMAEDVEISFHLMFPLYILSAIIGQLIVRNTVPYLIKMGSTRKNVFKVLGIFFTLFSLFNAILSSTIYGIIVFLFGDQVVENGNVVTVTGSSGAYMTFGHFSQLFTDNWGTRILIDFSIMFFLLIVSFLLGLIFYKYGTAIGLSFIGFLVFVFIYGSARGWLLEFFINILTDMTLVFFLQLLLVSIIMYLLSFILLRRLQIE